MRPLIKLLPTLVVFRPQSRNTGGFSYNGHYSLPRIEYLSTLADNPSGRFRQFRIGGSRSSQLAIENMFWLEGVSELSAIIRSAESSILTHSAYEIFAHHSDLDIVCTDILKRLHNLGGPLRYVDCSTLGGLSPSTPSSIKTMKKISPKFCEILQFSEGAALGGMDAEFVLLAFQELPHELQYFMFARRLARGPATDPNGSTATSRTRRPRAGLLKRLALHTRTARVPTTMEPELALLMANLARAGRLGQSLCSGLAANSTMMSVLDPCCGAAGLLVPAAHLGAVHTIGWDPLVLRESPNLPELVAADSQELGLDVPELHDADVLQWSKPGSSAYQALAGRALWAIVTDPPYGIRAPAAAPVRLTPHDETSQTSSAVSLTEHLALVEHKSAQRSQVDSTRPGGLDALYQTAEVRGILEAILALAAARLLPGGRCVMFVPQPFRRRTDDAGDSGRGRGGADSESTGAMSVHGMKSALFPHGLPEGLRLKYSATQTFRGSTFRRTLVVLERAA